MLAQAFRSYGALFSAVPEYRWLATSSVVSRFGDGVQLVALLWLVSLAPTPGIAVGTIVLSIMTPTILISPLLGPLVDRFNRRSLMIFADGGRIVSAVLIPLVHSTYGLPATVATAFVHSVLTVVFQSAQNSALPEIVGREQLIPANSFNASTAYVANTLGSAFGGFLIAYSNIFMPFIVNSLTFVASGVLISAVPKDRFAVRGTSRAPYWEHLILGLKYSRRSRPLLLMTVIGALATVGFAPAPVALVILAREVLGTGSSSYGLLQALTTVGLASGAVFVGGLGNLSKAMVMSVGYLAMGITTFLLGWSTGFWMAAALVVLRSASNSVLAVAGSTILQAQSPADLRGRVLTFVGSIAEIPRIAVLPLAGMLIDLLGVRFVYSAMGLTILTAGLLTLVVRRILEPELTPRAAGR